MLRFVAVPCYITNHFQTTYAPGEGGSKSVSILYRWLWIAGRKTLKTFVPITSKKSASGWSLDDPFYSITITKIVITFVDIVYCVRVINVKRHKKAVGMNPLLICVKTHERNRRKKIMNRDNAVRLVSVTFYSLVQGEASGEDEKDRFRLCSSCSRSLPRVNILRTVCTFE
jgi:hypothetical protein